MTAEVERAAYPFTTQSISPVNAGYGDMCESAAILPTNPARPTRYQGFRVLNLSLDTTSIEYVPFSDQGGWEGKIAASPSQSRRPVSQILPTLSPDKAACGPGVTRLRQGRLLRT